MKDGRNKQFRVYCVYGDSTFTNSQVVYAASYDDAAKRFREGDSVARITKIEEIRK